MAFVLSILELASELSPSISIILGLSCFLSASEKFTIISCKLLITSNLFSSGKSFTKSNAFIISFTLPVPAFSIIPTLIFLSTPSISSSVLPNFLILACAFSSSASSIIVCTLDSLNTLFLTSFLPLSSYLILTIFCISSGKDDINCSISSGSASPLLTKAVAI